MSAVDDQDGWIWLNGEFTPWRDAKLHVLTHGLHYGSAVFEGERMYGGHIFKLPEHTARLFKSAEILDLEIPFTPAEISRACEETCRRNGLRDAYIRPLVWRGSDMIGVSARGAKVNVAISAWSWPSYFSTEEFERGIRLCWAKYKRPPADTEPVHAKAAGLYMICTLSKHAAEAAGYDEAMMLDYRGYVAESTGSNVFFVRDGALHTPIADCFLNGITRQTVIDLAFQNGIAVTERRILPEELSSFSECFLAGTAVELVPVAQVGDHRFLVGPVASRLREAFDNLVRS